MTYGITGHQHLATSDNEDWTRRQLSRLIAQAGKNICFGLSALAIGADQIFAEAIIENNIPLRVVIPCAGYEKTFTATSLQHYKLLLEAASSFYKLDYDAPSEAAFLAAGKTIVNSSDVLLAVWNGEPAKGMGGTGDIISYARSLNKTIFNVNPFKRLVHRLE
jgi:hypothetical protein